MDLAAYNMLAPGNAYFGLPRLENGLRGSRSSEEPVIPPILLKSIAWIESSLTQATRESDYGGIGPALISFDCGHGIMQVTSGMTTPLGDGAVPTSEQLLTATHYAYNIARGAVILADKWNAAPDYRPVAGTDTNGDPEIVENWYFAAWSYNGFTGPGANRSNHPVDPVYGAWPRAPYSCGDWDDGFGHNRGSYPYQELIWGCAARPPIVDGRQLWQPLNLTLPDLNDPRWRTPLQIANFVSPYVGMDMPSPSPTHEDETPKPAASSLYTILGQPRLGVSNTSISLVKRDNGSVAPAEIAVSNRGTGVLSWSAKSSASWLTVSTAAGVAIGSDVFCAAGAACKRDGVITLTVNPASLPRSNQRATVRIIAPQTGETQTITVTISSSIRMGLPGVAKN